MKNIFLVLISIFILNSCNSKVGIQADETNQDCIANVISKENLANLLYTKDLSGVQFIDIRTPHQYAMGHLPNAINIPVKNFFDKRRFDEINKDDMLILYGEDASSTKMMALLASHFRKGSFYSALGGYDFLNDKIINRFGVNAGLYDDEEPIVDYQQAVNEIKSKSGAIPSVSKLKKIQASKPIIKRKKKAVSGGCG